MFANQRVIKPAVAGVLSACRNPTHTIGRRPKHLASLRIGPGICLEKLLSSASRRHQHTYDDADNKWKAGGAQHWVLANNMDEDLGITARVIRA